MHRSEYVGGFFFLLFFLLIPVSVDGKRRFGGILSIILTKCPAEISLPAWGGSGGPPLRRGSREPPSNAFRHG